MLCVACYDQGGPEQNLSEALTGGVPCSMVQDYYLQFVLLFTYKLQGQITAATAIHAAFCWQQDLLQMLCLDCIQLLLLLLLQSLRYMVV